MPKPEIVNALSHLLEVLQIGGVVYLVAKVSPDDLDALASIGAELEDLEDNGDEERIDEI